MWRRVRSITAVVLFALAIEYLVGWRDILVPWTQKSFSFVAGMAALLALTYVIRALRIYRYFGFERGYALCLRMFVQHNMLLNMLPMRAGEFAFPVLMKRYFAMSPRRSVPALVWLRLLDLHALALILALASGFLVGWPIAATLMALLMLVPIVALPHADKLAALLERRSKRAAGFVRDGLSALPNSAPQLAEQWLWTMFAWSVKMIAYGVIIAAFGSAALAPAVIGAVGGELVSVIPIHGPASLGTYESGIVAAMALAGISLRPALYGAVNLHLLVLCISMLAGVASLLIPAQAPLYGEHRYESSS